MRPRLKDIAERLNLSVVTVSKVLRNQSDISSETKARVLRVMKELNYQPNLAARSLATGRTFSVGLVVPSLIHPFFAEVAEGIVQVLNPAGYGLFISSAEENPQLELLQIERHIARQVDALLLASCQPASSGPPEDKLGHTPLVLIDRRFAKFKANFVGVNDEEIGFKATAHLIRAGCQTIAHIRGTNVSTAEGRYEGYRRALSEHGLPFRPELVEQVEFGEETAEVAGARAMRRVLDRGARPDGLFCFNDPVAAGALEEILNAGLRAPEDVAVIGCGDSRWSRFMRVPLSSVDQNARKLGIRAAQLALRLISGGSKAKRTILLETRIVERESTRRVREATAPARNAGAGDRAGRNFAR
jgi:LacI family transcriptional regulator